jgi:hypothetical protein
MAILELRILPPLAIGRLGSSKVPLEAFELEVCTTRPLDYRQIVPRRSFVVDAKTGELKAHEPDSIRFKDRDGRIRPVAPFLEVFAVTSGSPGKLVPLTVKLLEAEGLSLSAISWTVEVGNIKAYRRTNHIHDKIIARVEDINDHAPHELQGHCPNFLKGKYLPLGSVQFIRPNKLFPEIRLRFTPAEGKVYGASTKRHTSETQQEDDPIITTDEQLVYDKAKKSWYGYVELGGPKTTNPGSIFAGYDRDDGDHVSWGYLDDECDGMVTVQLDRGKKPPLVAYAHIGAGPPAFAPDTLPVRVITDELEQILLGPEVRGPVPIEEAEEIVRRALETVRHMNTAVMNGNAVDGRTLVASTMVSQDTNDFERLLAPIMSTSLVDNLAVRALHERVFNGLASGAAAWFTEVLRRPEEIGDLSDEGRRKMPALMRNADGRALVLTRRQINTVIMAAAKAMFQAALPPPEEAALAAPAAALSPSNRTAHIHHRGEGNPFSVLPRTAISNCFPGLEFDLRNMWRRAFEGIVLLESDNYVVAAEDSQYEHLVGKRLLRFDEHPTVVPTTGPIFPGGDNITLSSGGNPNAVSFMEWSNSLARIIHKQGKEVVCEFNKSPIPGDNEVLAEGTPTIKVKLKLRRFFEGDTAAFAVGLLKAGELTQGLCSPWQNDYRECACYYWAASRPDYVNVQPGLDGLSRGDMWMAKRRTGTYIPDDLSDSRLLSYDDLFKEWEKRLSFIIRGNDAEES